MKILPKDYERFRPMIEHIEAKIANKGKVRRMIKVTLKGGPYDGQKIEVEGWARVRIFPARLTPEESLKYNFDNNEGIRWKEPEIIYYRNEDNRKEFLFDRFVYYAPFDFITEEEQKAGFRKQGEEK